MDEALQNAVTKAHEQLISEIPKDVLIGMQSLQAMLAAWKPDQLHATAQAILTTISLDVLFNCFKYFDDDDHGEQIVATTFTVVKKLLDLQDVQLLLDPKFSKYLINGAKHPSSFARKLVMNQIGRLLLKSNYDALVDVCKNHTDLISEFANALRDQDLSVVKEVTNSIVELVQKSANPAAVLNLLFAKSADSFLNLAKRSTMDKSMYKLRLYEFIVQIASISDTCFNICEQQTNIFDELVNNLQPKIVTSLNILDLLNILEIVKQLASIKSTSTPNFYPGLQYLQKHKTFSLIIDLLVMPSTSNDEIITSFVLDFISDVARKTGDAAMELMQPQVVFKQLLHGFTNNKKDTRAQQVALNVLGTITTHTSMGLKTLLSDSEILKQFVEYAEYSDAHLSLSFLHALGSILESKVNKSDDLKALYLHIENHLQATNSGNLCERFMHILKNPFPEHRFAVFHAMRGLARHVWGVQALVCGSPLFIDFLLDRTTEPSKEGKEWKFAVAEALYRTLYPEKNDPPQQSFFDNQLRIKVKKFLLDGPFYIAADAAVLVALDNK